MQDALGLPIAQQNAWTLTYEWAFYIWFALTFSMLRIGGRMLAAPMILLGRRLPPALADHGVLLHRDALSTPRVGASPFRDVSV